ncbi:hypothetical protein CA265_14090 [Sphingobacteriaceae bacterium GW460-11-11-14-LB5]|nr:hypothetical protein CA265_14090 [Sphingobacteriaceae bacterium GW460-11-11-14-LB5]
MNYSSINVHGNLLSEDVLKKIESADIHGQAQVDFKIDGGSNLRSEIEYAWSRIKLDWAQFQAKSQKLPDSDPYGTTLTRKWMRNFFDSLGFELRDQRMSLVGDNGQNYFISHTAENLDGLPVHIVGFTEPANPNKSTLDIKTSGGTSRYSPHGTMQEYLNVTEHLFGIAANGLYVRLMRDTGHLIKLTYVEFDLRRMLEEDKYSEFTLLYRLIHASRFPVYKQDADQCLLQSYFLESIETGNRIRNGLSKAVKKSLEALGHGFLKHPDNEQLREALLFNRFTAADYYRQLLRVIYRLLFLMVTEERGLVFDAEDKSEKTLRLKDIYWQFYSIARIREFSEKRHAYETQYQDLWQGLVNTFRLFEGEGNGMTLGILPLDGDLFNSEGIAMLQGSSINNKLLLECISNLNEFRDENDFLVSINYRSLDVEELGSVYEGLLELHPVVENLDAANPANIFFKFLGGTDRKTTGSYYTRPELVNELINSALIPVIEKKINTAQNKEAKIEALLALKVCDSAVGSGHMLLAAARTIAWYMARLHSGDENPSKPVYQKCLRDAIQHCVYGVDMNPDAVELCKLALWLEGHNCGKPLSFLDHKIRNGNSLVGVKDFSVLSKGIPDEAFAFVTGDDKEVCRELKKANASFKKMQQYDLFGKANVVEEYHNFSNEFHDLEDIDQDDVAAVRLVKNLFYSLRSNSTWEKDRLACDIWTAAFFFNYTQENKLAAPLSESLLDFLRNPQGIDESTLKMATELSAQHKFFHWPLEFPDVFENGGFDVILGNPPWERIKLQKEEYFATRDSAIANAANGSARTRMIKELKELNPTLFKAFEGAVHDSESVGKFLRFSGRYNLTAVGDINTYSVFSELARSLIHESGRVGIIVPTGIATDDSNKAFFSEMVEQNCLVSLFDFENKEAIFPSVHRMYKFCLLTLAGTDIGKQKINFGFFLTKISHLKDKLRIFNLDKTDFFRLNPNTKTCPVFRTSVDAELSKAVYNRMGVFINDVEKQNPWGAYYIRLVDLGDHQNEIEMVHLRDTNVYQVPIYEAKLFWQMDHRFSTFKDQTNLAIENGTSLQLSVEEKMNPDSQIAVRYYAKAELKELLFSKYKDYDSNYFVLWRDVTNATNERTSVASAVPKVLASRSSPGIGFEKSLPGYLLVANLNSIVYDYFVRQKVSGLHFNWGLLKQTPVIPPHLYSPEDLYYIAPRCMELIYTAWDIKGFADDFWRDAGKELKEKVEQQWEDNRSFGDQKLMSEENESLINGCPLPPFIWNEQRRAVLKAEIDVIYAKIYGLSQRELKYVVDPQDVYGADFPGETFRVLKDRENRNYGEYRTKKFIEQAYDNFHNIALPVLKIKTEMIDLSLHQGIYSIWETAMITRFSSQKVTSWFKELEKAHYEGVGNKTSSTGETRISFHGLIELVVIGTLRDNGISLKRILKARADLSTKTGKIYPFATNNVNKSLKVSGNDIVWEFDDGVKVTLDGTSQINIDLIALFFRDIIFNNDIAEKMMPSRGNNMVVIDPKIGLGKPVIVNKEVPVDIVASSYKHNPGSLDILKEQYDLTQEEVMAAVAYMN